MKIIKAFNREPFLSTLLILLAILSILYPHEVVGCPFFVDWMTIVALTGLLIITTGLKESCYFYSFSRSVLMHIRSERTLSIFLILLSASLSTFLTNDITLFVVVPLTLSIQDVIDNDISKLIIFETISVNVGSSLTPIGNPQNLFLWHKWNISFATFVVEMLPLVVILLAILLIFVWITTPNREVKFLKETSYETRKSLFILSAVMLIIYLISLEAKKAYFALPVVFLPYLIFYRDVLMKTDWLLLLMFVVIFIDFHILGDLVGVLKPHSAGDVFLLSVMISQLISNVPASVFVSKFSHNLLAIAYGVNVGGNGSVVSSLANIIALRMTKKREAWINFHKYSLPYLLTSCGIVYMIFFR